MNLIKSDVDYAFGVTKMRGYFSAASGGTRRRPGVLIVHDAFGLDSFCMGVADRLATAGYAAFAMDLWGDRRQYANSSPEMADVLKDLIGHRDNWMGRTQAAYQALIGQGGVDPTQVAAIGYCLGGSTVLEFARLGADLRGVVSFHGGLDFVGADWSKDRTKGKLLLCAGIDDPLVPWPTISAFKENVHKADINWELDIYSQTKHSFTRPDAAARSTPDRSAYSAQADHRSWRAASALLHEVFETAA